MNHHTQGRSLDGAIDYTPSAQPRDADIVLRHFLQFQFTVGVRNAAPNAHGAACDALHDLLPERYPLWRYVDDYQKVCERLELLFPEYLELKAHPEVRFFNVTVVASHEIAAAERDTTPARPLSIEHLTRTMPALIEAIYAEHGLTLQLHSIAFRKDVQSTIKGSLPLPN